MQPAGVRTGAALVAAAALLILAPAASAQRSIGSYVQTNLVSDQSGKAQLVDSKLKNPWGLAFGPATPAWVANNGTNTSTLYAGGVSGSPRDAAAARRERPRRPHRPGVQRHRQLRGRLRAGQLHLLHREGPDLRLEHRHGGRDGRRRSRRELQGPGDPRRQALRDRLQERARGRLRLELQAGPQATRVRRQPAPEAVRPVRDRGCRQPPDRHLRQAEQGRRRRRPRRRPRLRRHLQRRRAPREAADPSAAR